MTNEKRLNYKLVLCHLRLPEIVPFLVQEQRSDLDPNNRLKKVEYENKNVITVMNFSLQASISS